MIEATTCNNAEHPHVSLEDISKSVHELARCERNLRRKEKKIWDELSTEDKEIISMKLIRGQTMEVGTPLPMEVGMPLIQRGTDRD
jgi:hypothetical protein